jgi:hypothetical protein
MIMVSALDIPPILVPSPLHSGNTPCEAAIQCKEVYELEKDLIDYDAEHGDPWQRRIANVVKVLAS